MQTLYVTYPGDANTPFDRNYSSARICRWFLRAGASMAWKRLLLSSQRAQGQERLRSACVAFERNEAFEKRLPVQKHEK